MGMPYEIIKTVMKTIYYILLIAFALIAGAFLLRKMRSDGKKLGDAETDAADRMGKELDPAGPATIPYEKATIGKALEKAWETFQEPQTSDIIELDTDTTGCQLSLENNGGKMQVMVAYVFKEDLDKLSVPDYIRRAYDGDLLQLTYAWPEEKDKISRQIQKVLGGTEDSIVRYVYWRA